MLILKKKCLTKVVVITFLIMLVLQHVGAPHVFSQTNLNKKNEFFPGDAMRVSFIDIYKRTDRGGASLDIGGDYTIDGRGYIMLPLVGQFKVIGYDRYTLAEKLAEIYKPYFTEPYVAITPLIRLTIMGPFFRPGSYRISSESSLWELIERAGGPQVNCDLNSIKVVRNDEIVIENLLASFEKGYSLEDIGVKTGDQIIARNKRDFGFRQVMEYVRFGMSLASLYLLILRWEKYKN